MCVDVPPVAWGMVEAGQGKVEVVEEAVPHRQAGAWVPGPAVAGLQLVPPCVVRRGSLREYTR